MGTTPDWVAELAQADTEDDESGHAVVEGREYGGVRLDGRARDLDALVEGAVSSYNATVEEGEEIEYARAQQGKEVIIPDRVYRGLPETPGEAMLTFEDDTALDQYDLAVPDGDEAGFRSVGDAVIERYFRFDETPERLEDELEQAVDGHLLSGTMLYVDREGPQETTVQDLAGGHREGVSLLYRTDQ